ncbi:MAG TPA: winged helix-turn-helix transcriptional regulator [Euryarchaeota archaeon]|nr:winged helix-turn-helix transcriptional regulator [Euryarchaeota archaeon]
MSIIFGTLGHRPQSLIPTIKSTEDIERVIFYYGGDDEAKKARDVIVDFCKNLRIPVDPVELPDVFDLMGIAKRIRNDIREWKGRGGRIAIFNIAGGTRPTSSAALLACTLEGVPTVYVHDLTNDEIVLPLLEIEYSRILSKKERKILDIIRKNGDRGKPLSEIELARIFGVTKATMNYHVKQLRSKGVIFLTPDPEDMRRKLVSLQPTVDLLLGE